MAIIFSGEVAGRISHAANDLQQSPRDPPAIIGCNSFRPLGMNMAGGNHNPIPLPPITFRAKMGSDRHFFARFKPLFRRFKGCFSTF
jgi:hypothetical protein